MNRTSPRLLDWWIAYYRIEPFGNEWDQAAGVAFQVAGVRRQLAVNAGVELANLPPVKYGDFLPCDSEPVPDAGDRRLSIDEQEEIARRMAGG